jgi:hypothetical protein
VTLTPAITAANKTYDATSAGGDRLHADRRRRRRRRELQRHGSFDTAAVARARRSREHLAARRRGGEQLRAVATTRRRPRTSPRDADAGDYGEQQGLRRHVERGDQLHVDRRRRHDVSSRADGTAASPLPRRHGQDCTQSNS